MHQHRKKEIEINLTPNLIIKIFLIDMDLFSNHFLR